MLYRPFAPVTNKTIVLLTTSALLKSYFCRPMSTRFHLEDIKYRLQHKTTLKEWIKTSVHAEGKEVGTINVILCSDEYLLHMNRQFLDHDYYTDIITFDYSQKNIISGDLYISIDRVKDNASKLKTLQEFELYRVIIHGVMHLCGYKDKRKNDVKIMRSKEDLYLKIVANNIKK
jgi:probable rRNA maturation factor